MFWMFLPLFIVLAIVVGYCGWQLYILLKHDFGLGDLSDLDTGTINKVYDTEDIFSDIEEGHDEILMTIPEEVRIAAKLQPGDTVNIEQVNGSLVIKKV